jgi:hypothetical protein
MHSLPLEIEEELVPLPEDSAFKGHFWAQPSVSHLRKLMRKLVVDPQLGAQVKIARVASMYVMAVWCSWVDKLGGTW